MERIQLAVNRICDLRIGDGQRANAILVLLNEKRSCFVDVFECNEDDPKTVKEALRFAGLCFSEVHRLPGHKFICRLAVAKTDVIAQSLRVAFEKHDDRAQYLIMGYPETAANIFKGADELNKWDYPTGMYDHPVAFKFSKSGKDAEILFVKTLLRVLEVRAPGLMINAYAD